MKKILLTIALVSSLAFSTVASAAVNYNGATDISADLSYDAGILDVATDVYNASSAKDVTLVVVAGENPTDILQGDIMYIDQIDMPAAAGAQTFQDLGLLIPENTKKATVIINNGGVALLSGTVSVEENSNPGTKFVFGDVNGGVYTGTQTVSDLTVVTAADAFALLNVTIGDAVNKGGAYNIGTILTDTNGKKFVFGDVNGGVYAGAETATDLSVVTAADAFALLNVTIGDAVNKGGAYDIGTIVTVK